MIDVNLRSGAHIWRSPVASVRFQTAMVQPALQQFMYNDAKVVALKRSRKLLRKAREILRQSGRQTNE